MSFREILASLQDVGELLIKRGSAMGPLVPTLILSPVLLLFAWLFRSTFVIGGCPIITTVLLVAAIWIICRYLRHYASFAKNDPDRLQSEEYRYKTAQMQMIAAKELPNPIPEEELLDPKEKLNAPISSSEEDEPPTPTDIDEEKPS